MNNYQKKVNNKKRSNSSNKGGKRLVKQESVPPFSKASADGSQQPSARETSRAAARDNSKAARPHASHSASGSSVHAEERSSASRSRSATALRSARERTRTGSSQASDSLLGKLWNTVSAKALRVHRRWHHIVREKRALNFPESERAPIQLCLFVWGMLPSLGSRVREMTWGRRKRVIHLSSHVQAWFARHRVHPALFWGVSGAVAAVLLFCSIYTYGTVVLYDGEVIGSVASEKEAETVKTTLEQIATRTLGQTYVISDASLQYSNTLLRRMDLVDDKTLEESLSDELNVITPAYCLYIDGERIGATPYEGALEELLEQLKEAATDENTISCSFAENVEIKQEYISTKEIMNLGYLAEILYSTKAAEVSYTVVSGDTWSEIAEQHGLTSKDLLALNPGYNINKLQIGEVLTLSASVPYLTMTVVEQERYVDSVPFDILYTDTANLYQGDYKVTSPGEYGAADVVAKVVYVNGEETERTVLSSVTLRTPVTESRLRGTKVRPSWYPTGTFRWPTTGRITSYFGYRKSPGGIGSSNHKGIDISVGYATPIYAADGGTVTFAGWQSGYGYLVIITHNNGYQTYYGHNSSLTVSKGAHVYKGQQIARAGSTGNSTGVHCHFEVRVNGVSKNPLNYLS